MIFGESNLITPIGSVYKTVEDGGYFEWSFVCFQE